jgi:hypothetical protein
MVERIGRAAVALLMVVALTGCSGGEGGSKRSRSSSAGLPTTGIVTAPPLAAPCTPTGATTIRVRAVDISYSPDCLATIAGETPELVLANDDDRIRHNLAIFPGPRGYYTNPPYLFKGRYVMGPAVDREPLPPLPAGLLHFHCDLHPDLMQGLFAVAPTATISGGAIDVRWATRASAPVGYVFDVQVRGPGDPDFANWLTHQSGFGAAFAPTQPGSYAFRVAIYPGSGELRPIGYSPPAVVAWPGE